MALLGAPSLLAACGSDHAARAGGGAPIRIGYVTPTTGRLAAYAAADDFTVATVRELVEDGFETTHGTFTVEILWRTRHRTPTAPPPLGGNISTEAWWTPDVPFISGGGRGGGGGARARLEQAAPDIPTTFSMERIG